MEYRANYEQLCPACHVTIRLGDPIALCPDLDTWTHSDCVERRPPPRPRCGTCADICDENGVCLNCGAVRTAPPVAG